MSGLLVFHLIDETLLCWCPLPDDESEINSNIGAFHCLKQDSTEAQHDFGRWKRE